MPKPVTYTRDDLLIALDGVLPGTAQRIDGLVWTVATALPHVAVHHFKTRGGENKQTRIVRQALIDLTTGEEMLKYTDLPPMTNREIAQLEFEEFRQRVGLCKGVLSYTLTRSNHYDWQLAYIPDLLE